MGGVYHFQGSIVVVGHITGAVLIKNSEHVFIAYENQTEGHGSSSQAASLILESGDVVFLRLFPGSKVADSYNHHTTFSGHLLFSMWEISDYAESRKCLMFM